MPLHACEIAELSLHDEKHFEVQLGQTAHRLAVVQEWDAISAGSRVLELGCGQGDMTAVLAAVASNGHVTAVDPAALTYGSPFTLGQAQEHLKKGKLGQRITFERANPLEFLNGCKDTYDVVVLAQCIWYFSSPQLVQETLSAIKQLPGKPWLLICEYSLETGNLYATPHIHAVLAQAALEASKKMSTSNVQTVLSPVALRAIAEKAGWSLVKEGKVTPAEGYLDGKWEVAVVLDDEFFKEVEEVVVDQRQRAVVMALRDAAVSSAMSVGRNNVRSMDVWTAVFE